MHLLYPYTSVEAPWQFREGETIKPGKMNKINERILNLMLITKTLERLLLDLRAVVTWVSKVTRVCIGFALLRSRHFLSQSKVKPKPIVTRSRTFSGALCRLHVVASSSDWFTGLSVFFVIGFGFKTSSYLLLIRDYRAAELCPRISSKHIYMQASPTYLSISFFKSPRVSLAQWNYNS